MVQLGGAIVGCSAHTVMFLAVHVTSVRRHRQTDCNALHHRSTTRPPVALILLSISWHMCTTAVMNFTVNVLVAPDGRQTGLVMGLTWLNTL